MNLNVNPYVDLTTVLHHSEYFDFNVEECIHPAVPVLSSILSASVFNPFNPPFMLNFRLKTVQHL